MRIALVLAAALFATSALAAPHPRDAEIKDADTRAWWHATEALSGDDMEGRDVASPAYDRAAHLVADRFAKAGLKPAGEHGTWFQEVPLHEVAVTSASFALVRPDGGQAPLVFLHQISIRPTEDSPAGLEAPLAFRGYCAPADLTDMAGKIAVCFNTRRKGLTTAAQRIAAAQAAGAVGVVQVDDPGFTIEPYRWPAAYARAIAFADAKPAPAIPAMTLSPDGFEAMIAGSGQSAAAILKAGGDKQPLPAFDIPSRLKLSLTLARRDYTSKNVLGVLPGTDPALARQNLVLSAHLDGYGFGEPVGGDRLYNGALDDAAYVALLVRLAERRHGHGYRRSVVFAAFTGEEKGLLGANWYVKHPTVPADSLVADLNLDQLRPLFPLKLLTALAVDDTSLGATARQVAGSMGIEIRPDHEPERGLLGRADHWPFMGIGVPAIGFIFGFDPGTEAEARYREWYRVRYHRPQDDLTQPMDFDAATRFNSFFYKLTAAVADAEARPSWTPGSPLAPKP
ncbi:M28 family peptidase [Phenylobacterium aquaticum]|uniref:M28 family peptidase n=1 Tax=Phenylobacterium aquaticum TaxID=1763816 RepID=UPI0026EDCCFB|nr:M28 family peptidase [Phenylobacterium aquaticum]